jgi:hypothetical protein
MAMFPKLPVETLEHRENLPSELEISWFKFASIISQVQVRGVSDKTGLCVCVCVCVCISFLAVQVIFFVFI